MCSPLRACLHPSSAGWTQAHSCSLPSGSHCLPFCLTACWSWLEQSAEPTELRHTTVSAPQLLDGEGAGMPEGGIGIRSSDFSELSSSCRALVPLKAFLDSLLTEEPFFRRLGGSGCRSMPGRSESRCLEAIHTPAHTACTLRSVPHSSTHCMHTLVIEPSGRESPIQDNLGHCHQP